MAKLKTYSKNKPCYYCGALPPSSSEHAPPRMMFDGFSCDRITVPACDEHNNSKSGKDRAIVTGLVRSLDQMMIGGLREQPLSENVKKAIQQLSPNYRQANALLTMRSYLSDPPEGLDVPLPYLAPEAQFPIWVKQLTAAVIWSATGYHDCEIDWNAAWSWSPHFIQEINGVSTEQATEKILKNVNVESTLESGFAWHNGWSASPRPYPNDIFRFQLSFISQPDAYDGKQVICKHIFYDSIKWYVWFAASTKTVELLRDVAGTT